MAGDLFDTGIHRIDHAKGFAHAGFGQAAHHRQKGIVVQIGAQLGHVGQFLMRDRQGRLDRGRAPIGHEMPRQHGRQMVVFLGGDRRDRDKGCAAETVQPQPAIGKGLTRLSDKVVLGPVGKLEPPADGPFPRPCGVVKDVTVAFVQVDRTGKFHVSSSFSRTETSGIVTRPAPVFRRMAKSGSTPSNSPLRGVPRSSTAIVLPIPSTRPCQA